MDNKAVAKVNNYHQMRTLVKVDAATKTPPESLHGKEEHNQKPVADVTFLEQSPCTSPTKVVLHKTHR
ncbi:hypothetical protein HPP92_025544 [Vanilla planifolia]|uniref:Uncharacterized protein n=1 Tax=Vanilla planifolia TaxID=51239 RepID=A0A835PI76_VANPL|nr:hypothetical protein HPP92_025544 [Vanilla planifolia]